MEKARTKRPDRLLAVLAGRPRILVVAHDNPDPDAVATGWAVYELVRRKLSTPVRLIGGGEILRAENRHMVKILQPPLELIRRGAVEPDGDTAVVMVDCSAENQNHVLAGKVFRPAAVIDHHLGDTRGGRVEFADVRPRAVASASIAASYLREQHLTPPAALATALQYAVRTETRGNEVRYSRLDRTVIMWLSEWSDPAQLAEIENAPLKPEYFSDLALALQGTFIYGDTALCLLPRASGPEIVGEVADLLIRCEGIPPRAVRGGGARRSPALGADRAKQPGRCGGPGPPHAGRHRPRRGTHAPRRRQDPRRRPRPGRAGNARRRVAGPLAGHLRHRPPARPPPHRPAGNRGESVRPPGGW